MLLYQKKSYYILTAFHIVIIAASNYLVQFPIDIYKFTTTWGAFTFPFIFLVTDLTVRTFGATLARKIIFRAMLPALFVSYFITVGFRNGVWSEWSSFYNLSTFSIRIVLASFAAYVVGQIMDIYVFNKLRQAKHWWYAPVAAAIFGNFVDTYSFYYIAFYKGSDSFLAQNVFELATVDYAFKMFISTLFFLPMYKVLLDKITIGIRNQ